MRLLTFLRFPILFVCIVTGAKSDISDEYRLHTYLNDGYNPVVRPVNKAEDKIVLKFDVAVQQLVAVNEKEESFVVSVFLRQYWTDVKMKWEPTEYGNITSTKLLPANIWLPDIVLYNNAEKDDNFGGNLDQLTTRVNVNYKGEVSWLAPAIITGKCPMDITYFPFDTQRCSLKFGSWTYHGKEIDIQPARDKESFDLGSYTEHSEWKMYDAYLQRNVFYYGCCPEPYPDVTVELVLKRKPLFYVLNLLLPMIFIGILTLLAFFLPAQSGERISFAVTLMLALTVFMLIVADMIPASSETIPMLGIFFTCVMIEMVLMMFAMCYSLKLHFKDPTPDNRIGKWTRAIIYNFLACRLGVRKKEKPVHANSKTNGYVNGHAGHDISDLEDLARNDSSTTSLKKNTLRNGTVNHVSEDSATTRLMRKKLEMEEKKMEEEEFENIIKKELIVCAKTFDLLALIVFGFMFALILLVYLLNTDA